MKSPSPINTEQLADSFKYCEYVAKTQARNFYYSFLTLPKDKKAAMCAIYAFMRYSDDVSDEVADDKADQMEKWNRALEASFKGEYGDNRILPAFHATAQKYAIPEKLFQELIEGRAESDDQLLSELIEQWVVQTEAATSHFPEPAQTEVDRELARLTERFNNHEAYASKLRALGLSASQSRQLLTRQIYIERYLDSKFRPAVQIEQAAIDAYYQNQLLPELAKSNQPVPKKADVQEQVRELLVQKAISELTAKWLEETKSRLKIERTPPEPKP